MQVSTKFDLRRQVPSSEEFTRTLGQISWLLSISKEHRKMEIREMEARILAPLMFKQVRVFLKGKQPLAAVIWAYASDDVLAKIADGQKKLNLQDWRSGKDVVVVDCISPLLDAEIFEKQFLQQVEELRSK